MQEKIKTLKTIHLAICAGVVFAYIFAGDITIDTLKLPKMDSSSSIYLLIPVVAIAVSHFLFQSQLKKVDTKLKLEDNLAQYQTASIIRWAILEGIAFILLFAMPEYIISGMLVILYLFFLRPSEESIKKDLQYMG